MHEEFGEVLRLLEGAGEPSLRSAAEDTMRKALLIAAASYFERRITECVTDFVGRVTGQTELVVEFVRNKAVTRQYHSWFAWEANNANAFFGLFGKPFREYMEAQVRTDAELDQSIRAFLELGLDRNRLVHQDFASFALQKTTDEIYDAFRKGMVFARKFPDMLAAAHATGL
jgi:hypothetical protein